MSRHFARENPRHAGITPYDAALLQRQFEAVARRADKNASEMLMVVEDEIAEQSAFENALRARHENLRWDDRW